MRPSMLVKSRWPPTPEIGWEAQAVALGAWWAARGGPAGLGFGFKPFALDRTIRLTLEIDRTSHYLATGGVVPTGSC